MQNILLIVLLVITVVMIITVLMQKSEGGALGIGGGGSGRMMSGKSAKNAFSKVTWWMGALFMGICLAMTVIAARQSGNDFIVLPDGVQQSSDDDIGNILPDLGSSLAPPPLVQEPSTVDTQPATPENNSPIPSLAE